MSAETQLEVFGTKEVSVKEFMGSSDKSLVRLSDYEKAKQNLLDLKEKHQARVEELVVVEKLSAEELKELNGIRAELREPRYLIQNIEKDNISVFEAYKKKDKANLRALIEINVDLEDKATEKLQAEEKRKKEEKEAEAKAEELRVERIKNDIDNIETYCYQVIQKMTFENLKTSTDAVEQSLNGEYDFEEYDLLLDQVKERVVKQLLDKTNDITARENQRLENEAMKQEIFDVRINRLKELGVFVVENDKKLSPLDYIFSNEDNTLQKSAEVIYNLTSSDFETLLSSIKQSNDRAEQSKRDAELKKQKDEQFEVRKNRLAEIGFECKETLFMHKEYDSNIYREVVYNASVTEFEKILVDAKQSIIDAEEKAYQEEKQRVEKEQADKKLQEEADKKLASEKKKADAENKARVKRLANDKEIITKSFEVYFADLHLETENQETKDFIESANKQVQELKVNLLTQLNEL